MLGIGLLVWLLLRIWPQSALPNTNLNWDFAQMAYLHHAEACLPFTDGVCLQGYRYSDETLKPGDTLIIDTVWSGLVAMPEATVALYSPAITRPPIVAQVEPPPIALAAERLSEERPFVLTIPAAVPPGLYVPRLQVEGHQALTPSGLKRGELFLRPVQILGDEVALAQPRGDVDVALIAAELRDSEPILDLQLGWFTKQPLSANYNLSLRLTDAHGQWLRQLDTQPGFGFLPSSGWASGDWTPDWLALRLPELDPTGAYPLLVQLYDVAAPQSPVLTRRLGELAWVDGAWAFQASVPNFTVPDGIRGKTAVFNDEIKLLGYELAQEEASATITLYWQALTNGRADYTRFVHVLSPEPGQPPLAQQDSYPVFNTYPTSQWTAGEIVTDEVVLDLAGMPAGAFAVVAGFYDGTFGRITAVGAEGVPLPNNTVSLTAIKIED
jgi:hypothetical protein